MSARKGGRHHSAEQQAEIARAVAIARVAGAEWKLLERVYDRDRTVLYRYLVNNAAQLCNIIPGFCNTFDPSETAAGSRSLPG